MVIKLYTGYRIKRKSLKNRDYEGISFKDIKSMMKKNDDPDSDMLVENDMEPAIRFLYFIHLMQMDEAERKGTADVQA